MLNELAVHSISFIDTPQRGAILDQDEVMRICSLMIIYPSFGITSMSGLINPSKERVARFHSKADSDSELVTMSL
jgi:hypothetical protein